MYLILQMFFRPTAVEFIPARYRKTQHLELSSCFLDYELQSWSPQFVETHL